MFGRAPEAALSPLIIGERAEELVTPEVRPQRVGDVDFGVGKLPQQEVTQAKLFPGADEQIRVGEVSRPQVLGKKFFIDRCGVEAARPRLCCQGTNRGDDLLTGAVTDRQYDRQAVVVARRKDGMLQGLTHRERQAVQIADRT